MTDEVFTSLDLEMNQPSGKIIQIGVAIGNLRTGALLDQGRFYVQIDEPLNPDIIKLTGITEQDLLEKGMTLQEAYQKMVELHVRHGSFVNPITWGGGDSLELRKQLNLTDGRFIFGRGWFDVKKVYQLWRFKTGQKLQSGLAKSMTKVGLQFKGRKHDAMDDAINTFTMAHFLLNKFRD